MGVVADLGAFLTRACSAEHSQAGVADAQVARTSKGRGARRLGLGFRRPCEQQIGGEIADQAVAAPVIRHQGDRGAAVDHRAADDREISRGGIWEAGGQDHQLVALEGVEIEDQIGVVARGIKQEAVAAAAAIEGVAATAAIEQVVAAAAIELVIAAIATEAIVAGITAEHVLTGATTNGVIANAAGQEISALIAGELVSAAAAVELIVTNTAR